MPHCNILVGFSQAKNQNLILATAHINYLWTAVLSVKVGQNRSYAGISEENTTQHDKETMQVIAS